MESIHRRPAQLSDIDTLLVMMERFYAIDGYPFTKEKTRTSLTEFLSDTNLGSIWLISDGAREMGYIVLAVIYSFEFGGKNAFVDEFYLEPEFRGKGIGRQIMDEVCDEAKALGIHALHLEVEHHNTRALELYRSFRFSDHHRILMTRLTHE
ncbi:MAG: GNAT family N-acetyltransferase [Bacteroidota bacterium]